VAVVGTGLVGKSWSIVFARAGCEVLIYDKEPEQAEKALVWISAAMRSLAEEGLLAEPQWLCSFIRAVDSLDEALKSVDFVQESVAEDLEIKRRVLAEVDRLAPMNAIIASSTSTFIPSLLYEELSGKHRCLVAHPMNPPHLAPVVELCAAPFTYPETLERTRQLLITGGQIPIVVKREIDGFVLNRLQHALLNEAFRLVAGGYVSPADLDETVKSGLALRWAFMGPLETIDLNAPGGTKDYLNRYGAGIRRLGEDMCRQEAWPDNIADTLQRDRRKQVPLDRLEEETRWRDSRMMALASHKRHAAARFGK
jgi:3-hydroxyacyl-CoA dehydrogenase